MENLSILVVDDDPVVRRLLQQRLKKEEYSVMVADDGYQAERLLKKHIFDVVLTDLIMPGDIGGIEVLEITKQLNPKTEVVLITAHSSVDTAVAAMKKGAIDYLEKPINFDELFLRIEKIANLKAIVQNAKDIGQAMSVTEAAAAATIQDLEIAVNRQRELLDEVDTILRDNTKSEDERIAAAIDMLAGL